MLASSESGTNMAVIKERRSNNDRRQAAPVQFFPILDKQGNFIEHDRRSGVDRRVDSSTTLQFIKSTELLEKFAELQNSD